MSKIEITSNVKHNGVEYKAGFIGSDELLPLVDLGFAKIADAVEATPEEVKEEVVEDEPVSEPEVVAEEDKTDEATPEEESSEEDGKEL